MSTDDDGVLAFSHQAGAGRHAVLARQDRVGDDPRLVIELSPGPQVLSAGGRPVGSRDGAVVRLNGREYRVRGHRVRRWLRLRRRLEVTMDGRPVLVVREVSQPDSTVHRYITGTAADLDPVVALALLLSQVRPDRMGVLGELLR